MKNNETCKWELQDDWPDDQQYYSTHCDNAQQFSEGTLLENGYKYCPYCGKEIEEVNDGE